MTKKKVVDSVFKNQKTFFIKIGNYQDISVHIPSLFANFWSVKFC